MALLEAAELSKHFQARRGIFGGGHAVVRAVDGISFTIEAGRTLGVVGESGCGKTTTAKLVLGLEEPSGGSIRFEGRELQELDSAGRRHYRKSVQAVFQDPYASLNPRMRVDAIIAEPLVTNESLSAAEVRGRVLHLLDLVGLPARAADLFPHEFSGGQRQRIAIARALALSPKLVVLDEPVSALDVSIRAQILNLLRDLQAELGLSYLFIAHDLAAVAHMSHTIVVMYLGKIVESGDARSLARAPKHPYTEALFSAALPSHPDERREEIILSGEVPSPLNPPSGCRFHPRCPHALGRCVEQEPALDEVEGRLVACHLYDMVASLAPITAARAQPPMSVTGYISAGPAEADNMPSSVSPVDGAPGFSAGASRPRGS
jgi:oligopeptide/dipeptide ABC transporter ATP-binding protein